MCFTTERRQPRTITLSKAFTCNWVHNTAVWMCFTVCEREKSWTAKKVSAVISICLNTGLDLGFRERTSPQATPGNAFGRIWKEKEEKKRVSGVKLNHNCQNTLLWLERMLHNKSEESHQRTYKDKIQSGIKTDRDRKQGCIKSEQYCNLQFYSFILWLS